MNVVQNGMNRKQQCRWLTLFYAHDLHIKSTEKGIKVLTFDRKKKINFKSEQVSHF